MAFGLQKVLLKLFKDHFLGDLITDLENYLVKWKLNIKIATMLYF